MVVCCTDHSCIYNKDTGYYGVCKKRTNKEASYGGITRMLVDTCNLKEPQNKNKEDD